MSEGLAIVKVSGRYGEIYDKWLGALEAPGVPAREILKYGAIVLFPLLALLAGAGMWSWALRTRVARATADLGRELAERKRAEEALRVRDAAIAESINAIAMADLEGKLTYVNDAFLQS